jgi:hypothetical protein
MPRAFSLAVFFPFMLACWEARAECHLSELVGYRLIAQKTISGYFEHGKRGDDFEGCDFDRVIVFADNTGVRCIGYDYSYSFMPEAYIFASGSVMKMCVEDELYDIAPLR